MNIWDIAKWRVLLITMFAVLFYASPNVKLVGFKWVTPGALFAIVIWLIASALFAIYVASFSSYDKTYGTLGGLVIFVVWMWLTNTALLLGMEPNAERERTRELKARRAEQPKTTEDHVARQPDLMRTGCHRLKAATAIAPVRWPAQEPRLLQWRRGGALGQAAPLGTIRQRPLKLNDACAVGKGRAAHNPAAIDLLAARNTPHEGHAPAEVSTAPVAARRRASENQARECGAGGSVKMSGSPRRAHRARSLTSRLPEGAAVFVQRPSVRATQMRSPPAPSPTRVALDQILPHRAPVRMTP